MRKLILHMAITLDGVVAPEGDAAQMFALNDDGVWADLFATLNTVDTVLIGGGMHREYLTHWRQALTSPKAPANEKRYAAIAERTPHLVLSRTLKSVDFANAKVLHAGIDGIGELKKQTGGDLMMWGGTRAAAAAIEAGFVDELQLATHPVIAGSGGKLFDTVTTTRRLKQNHAHRLPSGIVILKYTVG